MTAKCHCYNVLSQFNSQATLPCLKTMKDSQEELNVLNLAMPWRVTKLCTLKNRHIGTSSTELGIAESHFEKQSGILSQQFPLVNQSFQSRGFTNNFMGFPLLPTNISESAGKSALHDLSTHQVIIFLQAGSRWQTWRQNSMEIWDSWCSLLYLALRIAFTWSFFGTRMTSTSNGRYTTKTNRRLGCFNRNVWTT